MSTAPISISSAAAVGSDQALAGRDGRGRMSGDTRHGLRVFRRARLFYKEQMKRLHFLDHDRRHRGAHLGVEVNRDIDGIAQAFAHPLHIFHCAIDLCVGFNPFVVMIGKPDLEA